MLNLNIDSLTLSITNAEGHEHRIRPIVARAAAIFAERAEVYCEENPGVPGSRRLGSVTAAPMSVDLRKMTDEHAAHDIARSWLQALTLKLM
jgi:hypothetical protein